MIFLLICRSGMIYRIINDIASAITPPSLLGIDRRIV